MIWEKKKEMNIQYMQMKTLERSKYADEVVAIIAGLAAMEVDGVASMAGEIPRERSSVGLG